MVAQAQMRFVLLIVAVLCLGSGKASANGRQAKAVSGRIVAYSTQSALASCLNGNEYWSFILHVERPKQLHRDFARVDFSLPCGESADRVWNNAEIQTFHLVRDKTCDQPINEFIQLSDTDTKARSEIPLWIRPRGAENSLPFGRVVSCYHSMELPYIPIV
jgi:hypothetical protein